MDRLEEDVLHLIIVEDKGQLRLNRTSDTRPDLHVASNWSANEKPSLGFVINVISTVVS
jgi:hypothetical protein